MVNDDLPRYLIHDRDSKYTLHADSLLEDAGTKVIRLPVRSPDLNAYAECRVLLESLTESWVRDTIWSCCCAPGVARWTAHSGLLRYVSPPRQYRPTIPEHKFTPEPAEFVCG